jgi:hypothetical protein
MSSTAARAQQANSLAPSNREPSRGSPMPLRPEDSPPRQERLILADATQKFERLLINRIFTTHDKPRLPNSRT